jgi:nicotinate-nucleotide pyrophosphorylase (carboxylating)
LKKDFQQHHHWDSVIETELRRLLEIAVWEDTESFGDLTSLALIPPQLQGWASIHSRENGVIAGIQAVPVILRSVDSELRWLPSVTDGTALQVGNKIGQIEGNVQSILTVERLVLNLLGKLSGIATLTAKYVNAVTGTPAKIYDTRKTTLGWRRLEKYAVSCGGGRNHRTGLFDAVLIKDNHLAFGQDNRCNYEPFTPSEAVMRAHRFLELCNNGDAQSQLPLLEIEVDTLQQLRNVLPAQPDIVLLDNMPPALLLQAVTIRNEFAPDVELEASGGINLETVKSVALTGVERISVGALTHSATALDLGLDWNW